MSLRTKQFAASGLALSAAVVGVWAQFAPRAFYDSFPLPGHAWVSVLGPYNEHLVRDVGGLNLALLVVTVGAVLRARADTFTLVGAGWLAYGIPHLIFHAAHLQMSAPVDRLGTVVTLGGTVLLAGLLVLPISAGSPNRGPLCDHVQSGGSTRPASGQDEVER